MNLEALVAPIKWVDHEVQILTDQVADNIENKFGTDRYDLASYVFYATSTSLTMSILSSSHDIYSSYLGLFSGFTIGLAGVLVPPIVRADHTSSVQEGVLNPNVQKLNLVFDTLKSVVSLSIVWGVLYGTNTSNPLGQELCQSLMPSISLFLPAFYLLKKDPTKPKKDPFYKRAWDSAIKTFSPKPELVPIPLLVNQPQRR